MAANHLLQLVASLYILDCHSSSQLQDYALGQMEYKTNLGYVQHGCGTSTFDTLFQSVGLIESQQQTVIAYVLTCGSLFQIAFVWLLSTCLLQVTFKPFAQKTFTYSYDLYGMFWGATTATLGSWEWCTVYIQTIPLCTMLTSRVLPLQLQHTFCNVFCLLHWYWNSLWQSTLLGRQQWLCHVYSDILQLSSVVEGRDVLNAS